MPHADRLVPAGRRASRPEREDGVRHVVVSWCPSAQVP